MACHICIIQLQSDRTCGNVVLMDTTALDFDAFYDAFAGLDGPNTVDLLTDVDGVLNFFASRNAYRKNSDGLGYLRRGTMWTVDDNYNSSSPFNWSGELVNKLNALHDDYRMNWLYHSTWWNDAGRLNYTLDAHADGALPWDHLTGVNFDNHVDLRGARKYDALKKFVARTNRPFVWLDDDATVKFNPDDFTVPHLVLATSWDYGMLRPDLDAVVDFVHTHASVR